MTSPPPLRRLSRRTFLERGAATAAGLVVGGQLMGCAEQERRPRLVRREYGPLVEDPNGIIDLPRGFRYTVLSDPDSRLSNGESVPGRPDGMAAFARESGLTVLVRNHELSDEGSNGGPAPVP